MNLLGKLNWSAIPFDQPIIMGASGGVVLVIVAILSWVTLKGYVPYLWREGGYSPDPKSLGIIYNILALIILPRRLCDALTMPGQQGGAGRRGARYFSPPHLSHD